MQKNIGSKLALYPMPLLVIGTMVDGKPNWILVGHSGIIGHDRVMVSLVKTHYTNKGIKDTKTLSINIVSEEMLKKADYVGSVSGNKQDKSDVDEHHKSPMMKEIAELRDKYKLHIKVEQFVEKK